MMRSNYKDVPLGLLGNDRPSNRPGLGERRRHQGNHKGGQGQLQHGTSSVRSNAMWASTTRIADGADRLIHASALRRSRPRLSGSRPKTTVLPCRDNNHDLYEPAASKDLRSRGDCSHARGMQKAWRGAEQERGHCGIGPMSSLANQPSAEGSPDQSAAARVEQLYRSHSALVHSVCRSLLRDSAEAEDAVQQTFLSAQRALLNGSSPRDAAAWLATIARHESFARVRARMREPLPTDTEREATGADALTAAVHRQEVGDLRDALAGLPAHQREAILLREVRGLSYDELASTLSITTTAVESLLFRARRNLQARLRNSLSILPSGGFVRQLAARFGGGVAVPAATKALAVGAGAALITGGVVAGPRIIGLGQTPQVRPAAASRHAHGDTPAVIPFNARSSRDPLASKAAARVTHVRTESNDGSAGDRAASRSDRPGSHEAPSRGGSDGSSDSSTSSDSNGSSSKDGGKVNSGDTQTTSSGSTDGAQTNSGDKQTTSSGDGGTTTDSFTQTSESQTTATTTTPTSGSDGSGG
jgi:RNA polymerase sigma-70 factor, ECF subfamily